MIHLNYRDTRPIYAQICDGFREKIRSGVLCAGERLPSVRELATQLTINPNTIQRAYRELESEGWVVSAAGKGCFVSDTLPGGESRQDALLRQFDSITGALLELGISREALHARVEQGGN